MKILYFDRQKRREEIEKVYGGFFLEMMYGKSLLSRISSLILLPLFARLSCLSRLYGYFQKSCLSRWKIVPFIRNYHVDASEFLTPVSSFVSFNDFFIRHLRPECRPIAPGEDVAVLPADARYLVFSKIDRDIECWVKGKAFSLARLIGDADLAARYVMGEMVIARLCPVDYHRFHFPCLCTPEKTRLINGALYSVNPIALKRNVEIFTENKRVLTVLHTERFGTVLYLEVGATYVGSIHQTYTPGKRYSKGAEKGYFSFGGSCLIVLFEPNRIIFDADLTEQSVRGIEVRGLLGQSLGRSK